MFRRKKEKCYKLKKIYVCEILENIGGPYSVISKKILYCSFFHYTNPLTKQCYKSYSNRIGTLSTGKVYNICDFFDIPDEILLRGDYLTLPEILEYSKKLKETK